MTQNNSLKTHKSSPNPSPIIPWMGGKSKLKKTIFKYFPEHTCYVEPFAGGASLFFAKPPSKCEVLNDQNRELVNLYRVVKYHLDEFLIHTDWALSSRDTFEELKNMKVDHLTDIQRAFRFYYLQKHAFGGQVDKQYFGTATTGAPRFNINVLHKNLKAAYARLRSVYIENLDWHEVIKRYDREHTLFYLDPPYYQTAGYGVRFDWQEYEKIHTVMQSAKGMIVLSINDHPAIRKRFSDFLMIECDTTYSTGKGRSKAKELIIVNHNAVDALKNNKTHTHNKQAKFTI